MTNTKLYSYPCSICIPNAAYALGLTSFCQVKKQLCHKFQGLLVLITTQEIPVTHLRISSVLRFAAELLTLVPIKSSGKK